MLGVYRAGDRAALQDRLPALRFHEGLQRPLGQIGAREIGKVAV